MRTTKLLYYTVLDTYMRIAELMLRYNIVFLAILDCNFERPYVCEIIELGRVW